MSSGGFTATYHLRRRGSSTQGSQVHSRPSIARQLRGGEKPIQNTGRITESIHGQKLTPYGGKLQLVSLEVKKERKHP